MSTTEPAGVQPPTVDEEPELAEDTLTLEEALIHGVPSGNPNMIPIPSSPSAAPALASGPGINADDFLLINGKYIHKETICRHVLNKYFIAKSLNYQEQVYSTGFMKVNQQCKLPGRSITSGNTFIIGDIFLTIVCSNHYLTITLICSTLIEHHEIMCHNILIPNICTAHIRLTGQILSLLPMHQPAEQCSWLWTGDYIKMNLTIQGISHLTEKVIEILVHGLLVELVNPETTCVYLQDDINSN
ncbi:hypothetical protein BDR05DRAFT_1002487 [Suillus weaverae]|nr:hypothetical protein BDR05DRAFT_1002487 [Suillus weaverae]